MLRHLADEMEFGIGEGKRLICLLQLNSGIVQQCHIAYRLDGSDDLALVVAKGCCNGPDHGFLPVEIFNLEISREHPVHIPDIRIPSPDLFRVVLEHDIGEKRATFTEETVGVLIVPSAHDLLAPGTGQLLHCMVPYDDPAVQVQHKCCVREEVDDIVQASFGFCQSRFYTLLVCRESSNDGSNQYKQDEPYDRSEEVLRILRKREEQNDVEAREGNGEHKASPGIEETRENDGEVEEVLKYDVVTGAERVKADGDGNGAAHQDENGRDRFNAVSVEIPSIDHDNRISLMPLKTTHDKAFLLLEDQPASFSVKRYS